MESLWNDTQVAIVVILTSLKHCKEVFGFCVLRHGVCGI